MGNKETASFCLYLSSSCSLSQGSFLADSCVLRFPLTITFTQIMDLPASGRPCADSPVVVVGRMTLAVMVRAHNKSPWIMVASATPFPGSLAEKLMLWEHDYSFCLWHPHTSKWPLKRILESRISLPKYTLEGVGLFPPGPDLGLYSPTLEN